ncbi:MAG: hypothetical protein U0M21_05370 [Emergencia sp.]|nr:hypothetical protein [Emergencia sp.]
MRKSRKLAGSMLAVYLVSGIIGLVYLISLGAKGGSLVDGMLTGHINPAAVLLSLAAVMAVSLVVMILALPRSK